MIDLSIKNSENIRLNISNSNLDIKSGYSVQKLSNQISDYTLNRKIKKYGKLLMMNNTNNNYASDINMIDFNKKANELERFELILKLISKKKDSIQNI